MFKLEHGLQEVSICLRCRSRLRVQRQLRVQSQQRPQQTRHFGLGRCLYHEQAENEVESAEPSISYRSYGNQARIRYSDSPPPHYRRPPSPPKGRLGINSLGQPAEVLILRERQKKREIDENYVDNKYANTRDDPILRAISSSEMLDEINAERGIIDPAQVCENIDSVKKEWLRTINHARSSNAGVIAREQYNRIASKLHEGFTVNQLTLYLKRNATRLPIDPLDISYEYSSDLYTRSSWNPTTADSSGKEVPDIAGRDEHEIPFVPNAREKTEKQPHRKRVLVDRILRRCWQIRPAEDESLLGEMDIKLQLPHIELIVKHGNFG